MGLLIFLCGIGATLVGISGYLLRPVRKLDELLPDNDELPALGSSVSQVQSTINKMQAVKEKDTVHQGT